MAQERKYDVFICNSHKDSAVTHLITNILESNGYTCFIDVASINSGDNYAESISNAIDSCTLFLYIHSKNSSESRWCLNEVLYAYNSEKPILVINIDNTPITHDNELGFIISKYRYILYQESFFEEVLVHDVGKFLGRSNTMPLTQAQRQQNIQDAEDRRSGSENYIPQKIDIDIFISYRRVDGRDYARNIMQALKILGYPKVFFDFNSLRDGVFNTQILGAIYSCKDFILVISPLALKNCGRDGDWVAKEIREALKYNKKIIPIVIEDTFKEWPEDFPKDLAVIKDIQFHKLLTDEYFEDSIEKLTTRLTTIASTTFASIKELRAVEPVDQETVLYKVKVNSDCRLFIDDEEIGSLKANILSKIPLPKGEYIRKVVYAENDQIFDETKLILEHDRAELIYVRIPFWKRLMFRFHK